MVFFYEYYFAKPASGCLITQRLAAIVYQYGKCEGIG